MKLLPKNLYSRLTLITVATVITGYAVIYAYTNLPTQESGNPLTKTIWNDVVNKVNDIGTRTDGIASVGGNIGIGIASPSLGAGEGLHIKSNIQPNAKIILEQGGISGGMNFSNNSNGLYLSSAREIGFWPQNINTMTLTGGKVGIGTTTPTEKLQVAGNILASNNAEMGAHPNYPGYTGWWVKGADYSMLGDGVSTYINAPSAAGGVYLRVSNADRMIIYSGGNARLAGTLTQASDVRLKKDISLIENSLEKLSKLNGVTYSWKDSTKDSKRQIGVIAQDVEKVFPEAVETDEKGMKSVAYGNLVAPLIEAVKELKRENNELKSRIENLEKK